MVIQVIKDDLELLTGELIDTDITVALYHLLKDSPNKKALKKYTNYCVDTELREEIEHADKSSKKADKQEVCYGRLSLEEWCSRQV